MSLIVSDANNANYDGYFSTTNGFYRAEAYNFGGTHTAATAFTAARTISVTFANAGKCQGIIYILSALSTLVDTTSYKGVTAELQELVGATWTTRASVTLTGTQIFANKTVGTGGAVLARAFKFATPYTVDTTAGKWRFVMTPGTGTTDWATFTSNNTNDLYVSWCDNAVSYTSGDSLVALDEIKIDEDVTLGALFSTGNTTGPTSAWLCAGDSPIPLNSVKLSWDDSSSGLPAGAWTLTCKGMISVSGHSTFEIGTEANPIPVAQKAVLSFPELASGTYSGIKHFGIGITADYGCSTCLSWHGVNEMIEGALATEALVSETSLTLKEDVGFASGDVILIGGADLFVQTAKSVSTFYKEHTISAVSVDGKTLTIDAVAYKRVVNAPVVKLNNTSGIEYNAFDSNVNYGIQLNSCNDFQIEGVKFLKPAWYHSRTGLRTYSQATEQLQSYVKNCLFYENTASIRTVFTQAYNINDYPFTISGNKFVGCQCMSNSVKRFKAGPGTGPMPGKFIFQNNLAIYQSYYVCVADVDETVIKDNRVWNLYKTTAAGEGAFVLAGSSLDVQNNYFYGGAVAFCLKGVFYPTFKNNTFERFGNWASTISGASYYFQEGYNVGSSSGDSFLSAEASSYTHSVYKLCNANWCCISPTGTFKPVDYTAHRELWAPGTRIGVDSDASVANDCKNLTPLGNLISCGSGLTDTTAHTSGTGKFCIRLEPVVSTSQFAFPFLPSQRMVPTGNILGKTMMVGVWVKINSADYYSATYEKPRLYVKYDNGTTTYAEAALSTDWQYLSLSITPTTGYGQIEVWVTTKTDQTGASAYVYFDDFSILYPAGEALSLGGMDLLVEGLPVWPPISTSVSALDVWAASPSSFGANTIGAKVNAIKNDTGLIPALL